MGNTARDPVDHARTTRKHAGQNMKNTAAMPALIAIGVGVVALVVCLYFLAAGDAAVSIVAGALALLLMLAGFGWLARERRRVRRVEAQFVAEHPGADMQTPSS
jgi:O-antigen/teichoic acid export membrane protein